MLSLIICSLATSHTRIDNGDIRAEIPPPAVGVRNFTPRRFRSLEQENFQKTSPNFFDFKPNCEQLGSRYCDYASHSLGSGQEFASWVERTQLVYTNMARMDFSKFAQAPYSASYACQTKSGLTPFYWSSELTQASRFHSHEMATLSHWGHGTAPQNADLFGGSLNTGDRITHFMTSTWRGWGENIAAGWGEPLSVTKQWLESSGHCTQFFGTSSFLGVGYFYKSSSTYRHYWTQNYWTGPALPTQDIVAGTHDTTSNTNRFLVQVHMAQAPNTVLLVIGGTTNTMSLLLGTAKTGTYFVDVATLPAGDSDGCVPYHFEVNGVSRMPADRSYHFLTYGFNNCKRNIGHGGSTGGNTGGNSQTPVGANQCKCVNGTPKTGAACTANGASMCASCNSGFTMNIQQTGCSLKVCSCPNGTPKIGAACSENGADMCASCNSGFTINNQQTGCTASGGALPTCKPVPLKSRGKCQTCFHQSQCIDGFYCCPYLRKCVSSSSMRCGHPFALCQPLCFDNKCKLGQGCTGCDGCTGIAPHTWLEWANLANDGKVKTCTSATTTNKCNCPNGTPKAGAACSANGASMCASCNSGFTINAQQTGCALKACRCPNGTPKAGAACSVNGASMCASCNSGFSMNAQETKCAANVCNCANGSPKTGAACTMNGASMCASCNSGFSMNAQETKCAANVCNCANGTPKAGAACTMNGAGMCASCNSGFSMNAQETKCAANVCNCANGSPKTGAACTMNGAGMCASCNSGFTINAQQTGCALNFCSCHNGTPKAGAACTVNGASMCASCNSGFRLNTQQTRCLNEGVDTVTNIASTVTENPDTSTKASAIITKFKGPIANKSSTSTTKPGDGMAVAIDVAVPRAGALVGLCVPVILHTLLY